MNLAIQALLLYINFFQNAKANFTKGRMFDKTENTDLASWTSASIIITPNARSTFVTKLQTELNLIKAKCVIIGKKNLEISFDTQ